MSIKKKFSVEHLIDEKDLPCRAVHDEIIDTNRWSIIHRCVFEDCGKYWMAEYSEGATEMQDESPWADDDYVYATQVEEREVPVKMWVEVEDDK